jgi:hypothetical protein
MKFYFHFFVFSFKSLFHMQLSRLRTLLRQVWVIGDEEFWVLSGGGGL